MATLYELLGVAANASDAEIKASYRKLAIQLHPDKNPDRDTGHQFTEVAKAYETLRDPVTRQQYDQSLKRQTGAQPIFSANAGVRSAQTPRSSGMEYSLNMDLGDALGKFFENLGRGDYQNLQEEAAPINAAAPSRQKGQDIVITLKVTPQEIITGALRTVVFKRMITCSNCNGQGNSMGLPCTNCAGSGLREVAETARIDIPKGVGKGNFIERAGQGHAGLHGGSYGNFIVGFEDTLPKGCERQGADLVREVQVDFFLMILGGKYSFTHFDGEDANFQIPACSKTSQIIQLPGRGFPRYRSESRGDLHLRLIPLMPSNISDEQKKLLEEIRQLDQAGNLPFHYNKGLNSVAVIYPQENALKLSEGVLNVYPVLKATELQIVYDLRNFKVLIPEVVINSLLQVRKLSMPNKLLLLVSDSVKNQLDELGLTDVFRLENQLKN